jgi:serine/threonine protein kinase
MQINIKLILVLVLLTNSITSTCSDYVKHFPKYSCVNEDPLNTGSNGSAYVIKTEDKEYIMKHQATSEDSLSELNILQRLTGAPYVVQLQDVFRNEEYTLFIINYGSKGNLEVFVESLEEISYEYLSKFFMKLFIGVNAIHERGFVHADLKFENIVVDENGDPIIIDFDLSVYINSMSNPKGTLNYMSPEVLRSFVIDEQVLYTPETDLYSLMVMYYEMFNKSKPYILFEINYASLMNSEIFFIKNQPNDFYSMVSSGIMPLSNRSKFKDLFNKLKNFQIEDDDGIEEDKAYRMIEYAHEGEGYIDDEELGEDHITIVNIIQITFCLVFAVFVLISCNICCGSDESKKENNVNRNRAKSELNK